MSTIPYTQDRLGNGSIRVSWVNLVNGDIGVAFSLGTEYPIKTVEILGTFGAGGAVTVEGANTQLSESTTFQTLSSDPSGAPFVANGSTLQNILENTIQIRPNITSGDGTTLLTVRMTLARRP